MSVLKEGTSILYRCYDCISPKFIIAKFTSPTQSNAETICNWGKYYSSGSSGISIVI